MEILFDTLVAKLRKGIVSFVYKKKDGTERHACGTLYGIGHTIKGKSKHHQCNYTLAYYDVDCKAGGHLSLRILWRWMNFGKRPWTSITTSALHLL